MEPAKGGMLANPPEPVRDVFDRANDETSYTSWAIRFAASLDGVITVLSGMSNMEQMEDNLSYMKDFISLSKQDETTIQEAQIALKNIPLIPCTTCDYCAKVCPINIGISGSFTAMNHLTLYKNKEAAKIQENFQVAWQGKKSAGECIKCGNCEEVCPQHIAIRDELEKVDKALADSKEN